MRCWVTLGPNSPEQRLATSLHRSPRYWVDGHLWHSVIQTRERQRGHRTRHTGLALQAALLRHRDQHRRVRAPGEHPVWKQ